MDESLPEINKLTSLGQVEAHLRLLVNEISKADLEEADGYLASQSSKSNKNQKNLASLLRQERLNNYKSCWYNNKSSTSDDVDLDKVQMQDLDKVNKLALDTFLLIKNSMSDMGTDFDLSTLVWVSLKCLLKEINNIMDVASGDIINRKKKKRGKKRKKSDFDSDDDSGNNNCDSVLTTLPISTIQIEALCNLLSVTFEHMAPEAMANKLILSLVNTIMNTVDMVQHHFVAKILETIKSLHRCKMNDDISPLLFNLFTTLLGIASRKSEISLDAALCLKELLKGGINRHDTKFVDLFYLAITRKFDRASEAINNGDKMMPFKHFLITLKSFSIIDSSFMPHYLRIILQTSHLILHNPPVFIVRECISTLITFITNIKQTEGLEKSSYLESNLYPILLTISAATLKLGGKWLKLTNDDVTSIYHLMTLVLGQLKFCMEDFFGERDDYIYNNAVTRLPLNTDCKQALVLTFIDACNVLSKLIDGKTCQVDLSIYLSDMINSMPDFIFENNDCVVEYLKFASSLKPWVNISQSDMIYHNMVTSLLSLSSRLPFNYFVSNKSEVLDELIPHLVDRFKKNPSSTMEALFCDLARCYGLERLLLVANDSKEIQVSDDKNEVSIHFLYPVFEKGLKAMPLMYYVEKVIPSIYSLQEKLDPHQGIQENMLRSSELGRKKLILSALEQLYRLGPPFCRDPPDLIEALEYDDQRFPKFLVASLRVEVPSPEITLTSCKIVINLSKSISNIVETGAYKTSDFVQIYGPLLWQVVRLFVNIYKMDKKSRLPTQQPLKDCMKACAKFVSPQILKNNLINFESEWTKLVLCDDIIKTRHRGTSDDTLIINSLVGLALVEVARVHFSFVDSFVQTKLYESFTNLLKMGVSQGVKAVTDVIEYAKNKLYNAGGTGRLTPFIANFLSSANLESLINNILHIQIHRLTKPHYKYLNSLCSLLYQCLNSSQTARIVQPLIKQYLENLLKIVISSVKESHSVSKRAILDSFNYLTKCTDARGIFNILLEKIKNAKASNTNTSLCCSICMLHLLTEIVEKDSCFYIDMNYRDKQESFYDLLICMVRELDPLLATCTVSFVYMVKFFKKIITSDLLTPFDLTSLVLPSVIKLISNEELVSRHRVHVRRLLCKMAMRIDQSALWKEIPKFAAGLLSSAIKSISKKSSTLALSDEDSEMGQEDQIFAMNHLNLLLNGPDSIYNIKSVNVGGKTPPNIKSIKMESSKKPVIKVKKEDGKKGLKKLKIKLKPQITKQPFKYIKLNPKMMHEKNKNETLKKLSLK